MLCFGEEANIHLAARHLSLSDTHSPNTGATAAEDPAAGQAPVFRLSYRTSVELVAGAAREYFNSAASMMDREMDLAR